MAAKMHQKSQDSCTQRNDNSAVESDCITSNVSQTGQNSKEPPAQFCKHVSFHENIVSEVVAAPDPWIGGLQINRENILKDYLKGCCQCGVKPLQAITQQLQRLPDVNARVECLTLKGERLEARHCEALEEILRQVQFKTIDLEATSLDDEAAIALFDMIEYYGSAEKLIIACNKNIALRGWQSCARMLRRTPYLEHLDARGTSLNEHSCQILGRTFRQTPQLRILHLENCNLSGKCMTILVTALKLNHDLKELHLADNKLFPSDGIQIGSLLKVNHSLEVLDLRNNYLQDTGMFHICEGLGEQQDDCGLRSLIVWSNSISYQGASHLARALVKNKCLETLNIGNNNITNEGLHLLKPALIKNHTIIRLGLQNIKITCEGLVALAEYIADNKKVQRIDLRNNEMRLGGFMALTLSLRENHSITRIDIDKGIKKEPNVKDYVEQHQRLRNEIQLYCQRNRDAEIAELEAAARATTESDVVAPMTPADTSPSPDNHTPAVSTDLAADHALVTRDDGFQPDDAHTGPEECEAEGSNGLSSGDEQHPRVMWTTGEVEAGVDYTAVKKDGSAVRDHDGAHAEAGGVEAHHFEAGPGSGSARGARARGCPSEGTAAPSTESAPTRKVNGTIDGNRPQSLCLENDTVDDGTDVNCSKNAKFIKPTPFSPGPDQTMADEFFGSSTENDTLSSPNDT